MKRAINLLVFACFLAGCTHEKDPVRFAENAANGLRKEIKVGDVIYTVQYKPVAYILQTEHTEPGEMEARKQQLQGMAWFNISFRIKDYNQSPLRYKISGLDEYTARQSYYLNEAPKDIYCLYGKDTLYVNSYWFENNQNLATHETMVVGFRLPDTAAVPRQDLRFSFYDRIYRNGIIKAVIRKEDMEAAPQIN